VQTKRQIQQLLESACIRPNKRLGQHFLIDLNLMRLLVESADVQKDDIVLEVGCGTGSLTGLLAEKSGRVIAVDTDRKLIEIAQNQLEKAKNIDFIASDILKSKKTVNHDVINLIKQVREKYTGRFLLVSNLPYNIASPLILNLITGPIKADEMYVTVQKEVADRMTAAVGGKDYGISSVFLAVTGNVKMIRRLKPTVFWPQPKVDSAMISFVYDPKKASRIENMELFGRIVGFFMRYRRKTLMACIKLAGENIKQILDWAEIFNRCSINPAWRPNQLSPEGYLALTQYIEKTQNFY
jgi:16S rRNA (adenine1518-N6/adenine1519-N6)-dimethyltransferase